MTIKVFISHMNREDDLTRIAHELCDYLDADKRFSVWRDTEHFGSRQQTNLSEIDKVIRSGIAKSQIFIILFFPDNELSRELSDWLKIEERKAIYASMPVLEIYLNGAKQMQFLKPNEINYRKRYWMYLESDQKWMGTVKKELINIARKYELG